jgi:hypothetical protein
VSLQGLGLACELPFAAGARLLMMAVVLHPEYLTPTAIVPLSCRVADQTMSGVFRMEAVLENISDTSRRLLQQVLRHRRRR